MLKPTEKEIAEKLKTLPLELQELYLAEETLPVLDRLAEKYSLEFEQLGKLSNLLSWVLLKFIPGQNLPAEIEKTLGLDAAQSRNLARDLFREILAPVATLLELPAENFWLQTPPPPPPTMPSVKEISASLDLPTSVQKIGAAARLHVDQMGELQKIVAAVLDQTLPPRQFTSAVKERLGVDDALAALVTRETNQQIFGPIRSQLEGGGAATPPSRENILAEIENAAPPRPPTPPSPPPPPTEPAILEKKLSGNFSLDPKQNPHPPQPQPANAREALAQDPYLEPID